ncbi:hypothetical protein RIF29_20759 [Crotalaria pallida]|uniref:Uncharacterized protein n=1 Tax=Crotalaria pallida TaxID=3830 RepID=A0AAN9I5C7_CROPI
MRSSSSLGLSPRNAVHRDASAATNQTPEPSAPTRALHPLWFFDARMGCAGSSQSNVDGELPLPKLLSLHLILFKLLIFDVRLCSKSLLYVFFCFLWIVLILMIMNFN